MRQGRRLTSAEDVSCVVRVGRLSQDGGLSYLIIQYPRFRLGISIPHNITVTWIGSVTFTLFLGRNGRPYHVVS